MYIQDFFLKYYDYRPFSNIFLNKIIGNLSKISIYIGSLFLPLWFRLFPAKLKRNKIEKNVIVSFTSFPKRINKVWLVIECLLRQNIQPETIVLYLSQNQFNSKDKLPSKLLDYEKKNIIQIQLKPNDYRSHKKYWYAVKDFPNKTIITIDDDIIYHSKLISNLLYYHKKEPNYVIAEFTNKILWNNDCSIKDYSQWGRSTIKVGEKGYDIFFGSGGGTLFPCGSLKDANIPIDIINKICPLADDIWLNAIVRKNGYKVLSTNDSLSVPTWFIFNNEKLSTINNEDKLNDKQLFNVIEFMQKEFNCNPFKYNPH